MNGDRFLRVRGTTWVKATIIAHEWANACPVTSYQKSQQTAHQESWLVLGTEAAER